MSEPAVSFFTGRDGVRLAYRELGEGRPLILLHGASGGGALWLHRGQAEAFAEAGRRVILPDFRGQGLGDKPRDAAAYPADVLTDDALALLDHLALSGADADYDLGGYSLGARVVVRMLVRGATPRRAVVAGQGMRQILGFGGGVGQMLRRIVTATEPPEPGSSDEKTAAWLAAAGDDPVALLHAIDSVVATPAEALGGVQVPVLVAMGTEDERLESVDALVEALPNATRATVPGDHARAASAPEFVAAVLEFLTAA